MSKCYESTTLIAVLDRVQPLPPYLLATFFGDEVTFETESVEWHLLNGNRRPAPFVHPCVEGVYVDDPGWEEISLKPAYVKPKSSIDCCKPFRRRMGESCGAPMTPQQRYDAAVADALRLQDEMIGIRLEWMAAKALVNGAYTVQGKKYKSTLVDFRRNAANTVTLAGAATWDQATATPLQDLERWSTDMARLPGGAPVTDYVFRSDVWQKVRFHHEFNDALDTNFAGQSGVIDRSPNGSLSASLKGRIGSFNLWTYDEYYEDKDGNQISFIPDKNLVGVSRDNLNGVTCYGAIKDHMNLQAARRWPKMWTQPDPSETYVLTQSAPLVAPVQINSSMSAQVLP